jgi:lysophospholipase L1-like esterase
MKKIFPFLWCIFIIFQVFLYSQGNNLKTDWPNLKKYAEADKILPAPTVGQDRVVFMGNSITEFWTELDSSFFANGQYINRGISGQTSPQMLLRFRQDVINLKPAVVVILAGTNDIAENTGPITLEDVFSNIVSMVELARINNIKVILASVLPACDFPWHPGLMPAEKIVRLNKMIQLYCEKNDIVYLDYYSSMVDTRGGLDKRYSDDGVHPTLAGYKIMEPLVEKAIHKVLDLSNPDKNK